MSVINFSIMYAHAANIFTTAKWKTICNYFTVCVSKTNMNTSFTFRLSAWSTVLFLVSSTIAWSSTGNTKSRTKSYVHIEWIWRYMIRLGISFDILWIDMRIFSCHHSSRSIICMISMIAIFKTIYRYHGVFIICNSNSIDHHPMILTKWSDNIFTIIDSPDIDTKLKYVCWSRSSLIQMFC